MEGWATDRTGTAMGESPWHNVPSRGQTAESTGIGTRTEIDSELGTDSGIVAGEETGEGIQPGTPSLAPATVRNVADSEGKDTDIDNQMHTIPVVLAKLGQDGAGVDRVSASGAGDGDGNRDGEQKEAGLVEGGQDGKNGNDKKDTEEAGAPAAETRFPAAVAGS